MALIDQAIEHVQDDAEATLKVPIPELAHRVVELYWRQVRPFDGKQLRQSTQTRARIPQAALDLRAAAGVGVTGASLDVASIRAPGLTRRRSTRSPCAWLSSPCIVCSVFRARRPAIVSSTTTRFFTMTSRDELCVLTVT
jgi:hypothetical protein